MARVCPKRAASAAQSAAGEVLRQVRWDGDGADRRRDHAGVVRVPGDLPVRQEQAQATAVRQRKVREVAMQADELCDYVRRRLPVRTRLVGKERLNDVVLIAVTEWPIEPLMAAGRGSVEEEKILDATTKRVTATYEALRGSEETYGFFWTLILSAAISAIVQHILEWWLSRTANRVKMAGWQCAARGEA